MHEEGGFGVISDGGSKPTAVFREIEHAIEWGLAVYGSDAFRIRWVRFDEHGGQNESLAEMLADLKAGAQ
jgi:hypothetical protein